MNALLLALALSAGPRFTVLADLEDVKALPALHAPGPHLIHFWASWCGPCREELPSFSARARRLAARGVDVSFVAIDDPHLLSTAVEPMLRRAGGEFPGAHLYVLSPDAPAEKVTLLFDERWDGGMPATFAFIDGKKAAAFLAPIKSDVLEKLFDPNPRKLNREKKP